MIRNVLALIQTLLDIMRLQKGPDAIPRSQVVLLVVVGLWITADILSVMASPQVAMDRRMVGWAITLVALIIFALIVAFYRRQARLVQMMTALIGCTAIFTFMLTIVVGISGLLSAESPVQLGFIAAIFGVMLWSVIVDGHILARTIDQPRIVGVMISLSIFLLQLYLLEIAFPAPEVPANTG
ncbi:MAG: hypothetical protein AAFN50_07415 [Pseudomonadota bacterium]